MSLSRRLLQKNLLALQPVVILLTLVSSILVVHNSHVTHSDNVLHLNQIEKRSDQRILLLVGPHKAASTTIQSHIISLFQKGVLQLHGWTWPVGPRNGSQKAFAPLGRSMLGFVDKIGPVGEKNHAIAHAAWDQGQNLVIGAEILDAVTVVPDPATAIRNLWEWLPSQRIEVVVVYRTPRASHLVSAWKQQLGFVEGKSVAPWRTSLDARHRSKTDLPEVTPPSPSFAEWVCHGVWPNVMKYEVDNIIAAQVNPFGVASTYREYGGAKVTMLDMTGVLNGNVASAVTCNVMNLPCDGEGEVLLSAVDKVNSTTPSKHYKAVKNKRSNPSSLGLDDAQLEEIERIVRRMDCYYYCKLGDALNVVRGQDEIFAAGENSWRKCCDETKREGATDSKLASTLIRDVGCRALS